MTEAEGRAALLKVGETWAHTPYREHGALKGCGVNCAMLMYAIAHEAGVIPPDAPEPRWYSPQLHIHSPEERLIENVKACGCVEIKESQLKPGDVVAYLTGQSHGHLALVYEWPRKVLHSTKPKGCHFGHGNGGAIAGCRKKFFTLFPSLAPTSLPPESGEQAE